MTNCINCGAPLRRRSCGYCGSRYDLVHDPYEDDSSQVEDKAMVSEDVACLYADDQLVAVVPRMADVMRACGISVDEAAEAIMRIAGSE